MGEEEGAKEWAGEGFDEADEVRVGGVAVGLPEVVDEHHHGAPSAGEKEAGEEEISDEGGDVEAAIPFTHKSVFSVLGWVTFGGLLWGRWRYGWRGRIAVRWTLTGFLMLVLAYVGSKFVLEVILGRT